MRPVKPKVIHFPHVVVRVVGHFVFPLHGGLACSRDLEGRPPLGQPSERGIYRMKIPKNQPNHHHRAVSATSNGPRSDLGWCVGSGRTGRPAGADAVSRLPRLAQQ